MSKKYLDLATKELKSPKNKSLNRTSYETAKSYFLFKTKQYNEALSLSKKVLAQSIKGKQVSSIIEMNKLASDIYAAKGNTERALQYHKRYAVVKDSVFNVTKTNALTYYQTLYETERQEKEIATQKSDIQLLAKENQAKQRMILFGGIGVLLSFLIFYLYWNRMYLKKKQRMQESYSQKLLLSQEEERKRISKDLHDSLGQNLLLIKNKIAKSKDEATEILVDNAIEEMRSISRALHPFQLADIGITRALDNLIQQLDSNYNETYIFGDIENIDKKLSPEQEVNVFRIVQECFSNIIKHANADSAKLNLSQVKKHVQITLQDNGIGFNFPEKYNDLKSLGLKTIRERVKLLNGTLKIESIKNEGTTFTILFPV